MVEEEREAKKMDLFAMICLLGERERERGDEFLLRLFFFSLID